MKLTTLLARPTPAIVGIALACPSAVAPAPGSAESAKSGYAGCYRLAFASWPASGSGTAPYLPPPEIELSRSTGNIGSPTSRVIPLFDPRRTPDTRQFSYWKQADAGHLVIVWGTGLSAVAIFLQRSNGGALQGKAELLYDDGARHKSDATATPIDCGTMP